VSLRAKGAAVLAAPLAALFILLVAVRWVEGGVHEAEIRIDRAYNIRMQLEQLRGSLEDADQAVAGFLAYGQSSFLPSFD
jgi:hypothetical protein